MMNKEQLDEILRKHHLWVMSEDGGERANLRGANLRGADLRGANLENNRLFDTCGDNKFIKTLRNCGKYTIVYTATRIQIGCKNYSIEEWKNFSDDEIDVMDCGALRWWKEVKDWLFETINKFPARAKRG